MRTSLKVALFLVLCIPIGAPLISVCVSSVVAHKAGATANATYNVTLISVKQELGSINRALQTQNVQASISQLKNKLEEARKVEIEYRTAVDTGKSASECQAIAVRWGDFYQPIYDLQSQLTLDLGLSDSLLEQNVEALKAAPVRYRRDRAEIEKLMKPYLAVSALNSSAVEVVGPYARSLLSVLSGPKRTPAEVDAFLESELVRILNERKAAGK